MWKVGLGRVLRKVKSSTDNPQGELCTGGDSQMERQPGLVVHNVIPALGG